MAIIDAFWHVIGGFETRKGRQPRTGIIGDSATTVNTFNAPVGSPVSSLFSVYAQGDKTACYATDQEGHFANFEMSDDGYVDISIVCTNTPTTVQVSPLKYNINASISGKTITFRIQDIANYVVVINNNWTVPVWLFANPIITPPSPSSVTYYYGPGYYNGTYPNGTSLGASQRLILNSGQSAYIDGGAYIEGKLQIGPMTANTGVTSSNIHVSGYGVFDSTAVAGGDGGGRPLLAGNCSGSTLQGPTFIGHTHWGGIIAEANGFTMTNIKMINYLKTGIDDGTPDGVDIIGSSNVSYLGCFIRAHDDSIAIKTWKNGFGPDPGWRGNVDTVLVQDCVFQQGDGGNGLEIGYENFNNTKTTTTPVNVPGTSTPIQYIRNITYRRCDIVRKDFLPNVDYKCAALGIHLVDNVPLSNVLYEDVTVEYVNRADAWIWMGAFFTNDYAYGTGRAQITNVTLRRVKLLDGVFAAPDVNPGEIHLQGGGSGVTFDQVKFEDCWVKGSKLVNTTTISGKVQWNVTNVTNLTFLA